MGLLNPLQTRPYTDPDMLAVGEEWPNIRRDIGFTTAVTAAASGRMRLCYFTAQRTEAIASLRARTGATAAGATPTLVRLGIYRIDPATEHGTLVASTANDTTLFAAANTAYTKALQASWAKTKGVRYAHAILIVTAAAMPTLYGFEPPSASAVDIEYGERPRISGAIDSLSDLPASFVVAATVSNERRRYYLKAVP